MAKNPFSLGSTDVPLCNRMDEIRAFVRHAKNGQNALLYGSRRTGKTMLIKEVQRRLADKGFVVVFCDLFGVVSVEDISARICRALFDVTQKREPIFKRATRALTTFRPELKPTSKGMGVSITVEKSTADMGIDVLEKTLSDLASFMDHTEERINIVLDEFQAITEIEKGVQIQGVMRKHIQEMPVSFFYVGSRKRILRGMFQDQSKPFFQSTFDYELWGLPREECMAYVQERFRTGRRDITEDLARLIFELTSGYPYYLQELCHILFESGEGTVEEEDAVLRAFRFLLESEKGYFEATLDSLTAKQRSLLIALAKDPTTSIYSNEYAQRHGLGSVGGTQQSVEALSKSDLIAQENGVWMVTDPVLEAWLKEKSSYS